MDLATLGQAFNAHPTDLKHLLNTASIILAEHNCLNTPSRSKTITAARSEAVLAAIRSMPFFSGFFEKSLKRYDAFVAAMLASVAKLCDEEFRAWRRKRGEGGGGMGMHCVFETWLLIQGWCRCCGRFCWTRSPCCHEWLAYATSYTQETNPVEERGWEDDGGIDEQTARENRGFAIKEGQESHNC